MPDGVESQTGGRIIFIVVYCKWVKILERIPGGMKLVEVSNEAPSDNPLSGRLRIKKKLKLISEQDKVQRNKLIIAPIDKRVGSPITQCK